MEKNLTVLITGTSKGLGYDLVKIFLKRLPQVVIYATSRDGPQKAEQRWKDIDTKKVVKCMELELCNSESIKKFIQKIETEKVRFDLIINNAGVLSPQDSADRIPELNFAIQTLATNTLGTIDLTKQLLPHLAEHGRIIQVSSGFGALKLQPKKTQDKFNHPGVKEEDIFQGVKDFLEAVEKKNMEKYYSHSYAMSKMLLNAWSRFILQQLCQYQGSNSRKVKFLCA